MEMAEDASENIVIVGGGICGLATALALHRKGIKSLVLERSESLRASGAAIIVHSNGWRALDQLGVASYLRQLTVPILSGQFHSLDDDKLQKLPVGKDELRCVKRIDLMTILADNLPQNSVRFGCNVLSVELDSTTSTPVLQLEDGTSLNAKVVIGCDGVNSTISHMMGVMPRNIFNICVVRGFTSYSSGHDFDSSFKMTKKNNVQVGLMPITTNLVYWFITGKYISQKFKISQQSHKVIRDITAGSVKDFPSSIKEMVENCSLESLHFSEYLRYQAPWDIVRRRFRDGTVTVAGDAMHAMTPFIAQGGSASLEDGVVLARCLAQKTSAGNLSGRVSKKMVEEALDEYLKERKPRVLRLSLQSYLFGKMHDTSSKFIKFICIVFLTLIFYDSHGHTRYDCGSL
ncbi:monooxygenase 1-like [Argentina anserina]|uniref:monooxygenase 1-like n=1 Tax=Argentina anserina TaxID=57926 RepID=UPI0021762CB1|nr:monooxygenase 1-like [Potentilla anserina]